MSPTAFLAIVAAQAIAPATTGQPASQPGPQPQAAPVANEGRLGAAGQGGGEVVVTARRRAESVQRVPIAMSVIGGTALAETGAYNVNRLQQLQPSLQFYSTNPRNSAATIRGLGAPFGLTNDGIEQGVGIYVDGVYHSRIRRRSTSPTPTGSRCCAARKRHCTARTRRRAPSTSIRARRHSRRKRASS